MEKALSFARNKHRHQKRKNGEAYIYHPLAVYRKIRFYNLGQEIEQAALLHDVYEDCDVTLDELEAEFGEEVKTIVYYLSKEPKANFCSEEQGQKLRLDNYLEKLKRAFWENYLIMFIKIADQLNNLETIDFLGEKKFYQNIKEVKKYYLPIYNRFEPCVPLEQKEIFFDLYHELEKRLLFFSKRGYLPNLKIRKYKFLNQARLCIKHSKDWLLDRLEILAEENVFSQMGFF